MKQIEIEGGYTLEGTIDIGGAKNSAVALLPVALLSDETITIDNIPNISDIDALIEILTFLEAEVKRENNRMEINCKKVKNKEIPKHISTKLRASYYFMAALLGRYKKVEMFFPGGCPIGERPIDQTLKGFKALGATVIETENKVTVHAEDLKGAHVYLDMPSVGATINTMITATKAKGETIIENAAKEPEIVNVATLLNNMGAKISGAGTSEIKITGVEKLTKGFVEVIPDRIEAGTYIIAGALMGNKLKVNNIIPEHIESLILKLKEMGVKMIIEENSLTVSKTNDLKPVKIKTIGYPGFPTDLQQPLTVLLLKCKGTSFLEETIYENRFQNIPYLINMGAQIKQINNSNIEINGSINLKGAITEATDLRAGACLILAGLTAEGTTYINKAEHILRGYEDIVKKLNKVGAKIKIND